MTTSRKWKTTNPCRKLPLPPVGEILLVFFCAKLSKSYTFRSFFQYLIENSKFQFNSGAGAAAAGGAEAGAAEAGGWEQMFFRFDGICF